MDLTKTMRYLEYGEQLKSTNTFRCRMVALLTEDVPAEISEMILQEYAALLLPPAVKFEYGSPSTLASIRSLLLQGLSTIRLVCRSPGFEIDSSRAKVLSKQVDEAIVKSTAITSDAVFPSSRQLERAPYPACLTYHAQHIQRMHLNVVLPWFAWSAKPTKLFSVQDHLPAIKTFLPNLKAVKLDIVEDPRGTIEQGDFHDGGRLHGYVGRDGEYTTMEEELESVVRSLRESLILKRTICFYDNVIGCEIGGWSEELAVLGRETRNVVGVFEGVVAQELVESPGVEFVL